MAHVVDNNVYFINYKNSLCGTGGVGTTSRDMARLEPNILYIFWDGSEAIRSTDISIKVDAKLHESVHNDYAKSYLWPIMHGLKPSISSNSLKVARKDLGAMYQYLADSIVEKTKSPKPKTYWVNDYTSIPLVKELKTKINDSTVVFSFRTPFGTKKSPVRMYPEDINIFLNLMYADLITFHRKIDMELFTDFLKKNLPELINSVNLKNRSGVINVSNRVVRLLVLPEGNNYQYRKGLLLSAAAKEFSRKVLEQYSNKLIVSAISRFETSKGIEYEISLIEAFFHKYPEFINKLVFIRYTYVSKNKHSSIEYRKLLGNITNHVNNVNELLGNDNWEPIVLIDKKLTDEETAGLFMASDIFIIASLADGFNHLMSEAIFSRNILSPMPLLVSDIGATDYIKGYYPLIHSIPQDIKTLYDIIESNTLSKSFRQLSLLATARRISSKRWLYEILNAARIIRNIKI